MYASSPSRGCKQTQGHIKVLKTSSKSGSEWLECSLTHSCRHKWRLQTRRIEVSTWGFTGFLSEPERSNNIWNQDSSSKISCVGNILIFRHRYWRKTWAIVTIFVPSLPSALFIHIDPLKVRYSLPSVSFYEHHSVLQTEDASWCL